ncbi:tetratricopeptide repeat protein [bacterium]|nr:tetratricopeptide repeat protein [bacterium]
MDKKKLAKQAFQDFREGHYEAALKKYKQMLSMDPADINTIIILGDVSEWLGQLSDALRYYKDAILLLFSQPDSGEKIEMIKNKMTKLDPDSVDDITPPVSQAEKAKQDSPELNQAVEQLKNAITRDPKNFENYQKLGDLLAKNGRNQEAAEYYLIIGNALYNNRMYKKAGAVFRKIIQLDSACLPARIAMGEIYVKEGSDSDAKKEFLYAAEEFIRQGNFDRGKQFAQKAIQHKSIEAHYYLGLVHLHNQKTEDARQEFETLLKFKVSHMGGLTQLARIFTQMKQWDDAGKLYERLIKKDAKNATAHERIANIAIEKNDIAGARDNFIKAMDMFATKEEWERTAICASQAVKQDSNNQELYLKLADASYNAGLEEQAAGACNALADLLEAQGKIADAENMRAKAAELTGGKMPQPASSAAKPVEPPPPAASQAPAPKPKPSPEKTETQVMLNIADTYVQQGSLDEAIEIYQKILKSDPKNINVKNALTRVYAMFAGINPETAIARKKVSEPVVNNDEEKEEQRVQREARERALREAQVRAQRSTAQEPQQTTVLSKEPELLQSISNTQGDEVAGDSQDEFMTVTVAEIYTKQGLLNEALKIYQKILEIEPGNMEAQVKKQSLEGKMAEQEKLSKQTQARTKPEKPSVPPAGESKPDPKKEEPEKKVEKKGEDVKKSKTPEMGTEKPKSTKDDDRQEPPSKGRRGRVSYV